jgi:hypothetical protein
MAETDLVLAVSKIVDEMRKAGTAPSGEDLTRLAAVIAEGFHVEKDEVAILRFSPEVKTLSFLYPLKLAVIGSIPVTAPHSLAAKNFRDKHAEIANNFHTYQHATVFEAVDLSEEEKAAPIQKIMSLPMIVQGKGVGVIQISRKAWPGERVGPDFTPADLAQLAAVGPIVGKFLVELSPPPGTRSKPRGKT